MKKNDYNYYLLGFLILVIEAFIQPFGEFPLNDDWCYAIPVRDLLNGEPLKLVNWGSMTLVTQILWGFLFGKIFGFSFFILRLSVLSLHLVSSLLLHKILSTQIDSKNAIIFTVLYVLNPLIISLSNTFMTDVTFLSLTIITIYFYIKYSENTYQILNFIFSIILTILLILTRQIGVFLPLSFLLISLFSKNKRLIIFYLVILFISIFTLQVYEIWLVYSENKVNNYFKPSDLLLSGFKNLPQIAFSFYHRLSLYFFYSGIFLLPISIIICIQNVKNETKTGILKMLLFSLPFIICALRAFPSFPFHNVMSSVSVDTKLLYDIFIPNSITDYNSYYKVNLIFKILGLVGAFSLIFSFYFVIKNINFKIFSNNLLPKIGLFCFIIYAFMMAFSDAFMDRYILPVFLSTIFILSYFKSKFNYFSYTYIVMVGLFGILCTHDYFEWNKSRKIAYDYLTQVDNIKHLNIHSGIDMWGWQNYKHNNAENWRNEYVQENWKYFITFRSDIENTSVFKKFPYQRYIPLKMDTIYILK
ncbi:MAG: hypothetical protein EAZ27_01185 [Cytophagales bacterium]|nr:MAG: hypothetical protein EAZ27_01185 [Cytophagales bacterium]